MTGGARGCSAAGHSLQEKLQKKSRLNIIFWKIMLAPLVIRISVFQFFQMYPSDLHFE